ncbi:TonB-dependent receptor [uncultured Culturomica sp.]|uniref:SusC/RagA family TonB-linked outer membrane protein n=1 Tax=uncultured Culturomica sp. TaxID=1926654 RepID=UPI00033E3D13|nr:TonB-dependent receptor [uncultured Culturomica sp.]CCZ10402.1 outer membrane protein [Odoribacter sp. CAG:788]
MKYVNMKVKLLFVLCMLLSVSAFAQQRVLTGKVTDTKGETLPGVSILIKGTSTGTATDFEGNFSLNVENGNVLEFSFVGYKSQAVTITDQKTLHVVMQEDVEQLDEVVVIGYGTQNKREVTGSVSKIGGDEVLKIPTSSFDATLQGRASGVQVVQTSGMAGAGAAIRVRGIASITAGGDPLYVIDGMPIQQNSGERIGASNTNPLATINPNDIESIDILKDASATAIYGSRGANGVVLITTKRGKKGKPVFNVNYRTSLSTITKKLDMLNTREYLGLLLEGYENDAIYGGQEYNGRPSLLGGLSWEQAMQNDTDWQDALLRTGWSNFVDFSVQQGNDRLKTYFGLSASNENSFIKENSFKRLSSRLNLDYNVTKKFTTGINASYTYTDETYVPVGWDGGIGTAWSKALPYFPIYNEDGTYFKFPDGTNPVAEIHNRQSKTRTSRVMGSLYLNYEILEGLSIRAEGNIDFSERNRYALTTSVLTTTPSSNKNYDRNMNWNAKALANYSFDLGEAHRFKVMVGTEFMKSETDYRYHNVTFEPGKEDWLYKDPTLPTESSANKKGTSPTQAYSFVSFFGRLNYTLLDRYLLTATYRRDGSSRFGANNKFGDFPAASVGWIISEENFMNPVKDVLSLLKLKVGYGMTGNAEIPNYAQWGTTSIDPNQMYYIVNNDKLNPGNFNLWYISGLANPDLKWEKTNTFDVGLEFGFLNNRITGEIGYYNKQSKDLFLNVRTSTSSGWGSILKNLGKVENKGFEFNIKSRNIIKKDFTWTTDFNIAHNVNKVKDIGNAGPDALAGNGDTRVMVGKPIGVNYLVKTLGIDPADGMPMYQMLDESGKAIGVTKEYNADRDRQAVGHPYPDYIGGLDNNFTYKNWDFGFLFTFQIGGNIYDDAEKFQMNNLGAWNLKTKALDRWQKPGDRTDVNRATIKGSIEASRNTTEYLYDASFLRLKSVSLGYNLPQSLVKRMHLQNVRLSFSGTNLFCWTKYKGLDPEIFRDMENQQQRNLSMNVTYLTVPQARNFTFNLSITF